MKDYFKLSDIIDLSTLHELESLDALSLFAAIQKKAQKEGYTRCNVARWMKEKEGEAGMKITVLTQFFKGGDSDKKNPNGEYIIFHRTRAINASCSASFIPMDTNHETWVLMADRINFFNSHIQL